MIEPDERDIGRKVIYQREWMKPDDIEYGVITSFNDKYVFVKYGSDTHSKATRREDLGWVLGPQTWNGTRPMMYCNERKGDF